jgi:very-short-patch-repair endonuclease
MRRTLSPPEARLWVELKGLRSEGFHFRRQAPFQIYYLDFVCFSRRLVVEVDGQQHGLPEQARRDAVRDNVLRREGFRVLRYPAEDVRTNLYGVISGIRAILVETPPTRPLRGLPPHEGGGDR